MRSASLLALLAALPSLAALACTEPPFHGALYEPAEPAPEIAGTNWNGEPFSLHALAGRVTVVFFGYTSCPDVCPRTMALLGRVKADLGDAGDDLAVVLVSVDPNRDSVGALGRYVNQFDPDFYGVHASLEALDGIASAYTIGFQIHRPDFTGFYTVDHPGSLFVIDRRGRLRLRFRQDHGADEIRSDLARLLREPAQGVG